MNKQKCQVWEIFLYKSLKNYVEKSIKKPLFLAKIISLCLVIARYLDKKHEPSLENLLTVQFTTHFTEY